ncbi:DUF2628 domain-containing protein [Candidatus Tisiphia endosymbiont of Mystacides longicornis]|uniref:DUF2628 domain-containing protein n=1 Tax=Candidatus Tisiphia endosymbiont of Mystacides longicornis TaxID=3139330 RepID=UPI003CCA8D92
MNIYSIYVNPQKKDNDFIIIKQGFSLFAAFFNIFWALYHRMWLALIITLIISVAISSLGFTYLTFASRIAIMLIFGFFAADMREYDLKQKKYRLTEIILAKSEIEGILAAKLRNTI